LNVCSYPCAEHLSANSSSERALGNGARALQTIVICPFLRPEIESLVSEKRGFDAMYEGEREIVIVWPQVEWRPLPLIVRGRFLRGGALVV